MLQVNQSMGWVGLGGFNVGLELHKCDIADGLGFIPEGDQETCHHNFDPPRRGWLPHFGTPEVQIEWELGACSKIHR